MSKPLLLFVAWACATSPGLECPDGTQLFATREGAFSVPGGSLRVVERQGVWTWASADGGAWDAMPPAQTACEAVELASKDRTGVPAAPSRLALVALGYAGESRAAPCTAGPAWNVYPGMGEGGADFEILSDGSDSWYRDAAGFHLVRGKNACQAVRDLPLLRVSAGNPPVPPER